MTENKWFSQGLNFKCTECGKCCTGSPGYVWVTEKEMEAIADFLNITMKEFMRRYVRRVGGRFSLIESKTNYDCIFLKNKKCMVYGARPKQCRTYPWWPQNLHSKQAWEETAKTCEGIYPEAPLVSLKVIEEQKQLQESDCDRSDI
jgi:Fe-S-cluster containining protein